MLFSRFHALVVLGSTPIKRPSAAGPPASFMISACEETGGSGSLIPSRYILYPSRSSAFGMTHTQSHDSRWGMSEQSDRLQQAMKPTGLSMKEMAERWGWSYDTLKSNANGSMPFSMKKARVYAGRLKVRAEWLYDGTGPVRDPPPVVAKRPPVEVPVIGWVQAGQLSDVTSFEELPDIDTMTVPDLAPGRWFATNVVGDSMDRVSPEHSRIIVNADDKALKAGGYYVFSLRGEATYKRYYPSPARLEPYSTNPANRTIFLDGDPEWLVVGKVRRSLLDLD